MFLGHIANLAWAQPNDIGPSTIDPPLAGENTISALDVHQDRSGNWIAEFDYFYSGQPQGPRSPFLRIDSIAEPIDSTSSVPVDVRVPAERGSHHVSAYLPRPPYAKIKPTTQVIVYLFGGDEPIASQKVTKKIDWPDLQTWVVDQVFATKSPDEIYKHSVELIDAGDGRSLDDAKRLLERLITNNVQFVPGYIELARIAMKSNWGPEGLHQAEDFLSSALKIQPGSVNAKILLGYVYTHQKRFKEAENLFVQASQTETKNMWLWANWGELLLMQGKLDQAILKYRQALAGQRSHDTYDRARLDAYKHLIALLENKKDLDQVEALLKQRIAEFGNADCNCSNHCFIADYVRFLVQNRDDVSRTIELGRQALKSKCSQKEARAALGLAYYATWARDKSNDRDNLLRQAHIYLPSSAGFLYQLASSDHTMIILKQLVAEGESLDQVDNNQNSALTYAIGNRDNTAAKRLLTLGAKTNATVTSDNVPVALIPVLNGDIDGVRLMVQFGVDYSALRYHGVSANEYAKQLGNAQLLKALEPRAQGL